MALALSSSSSSSSFLSPLLRTKFVSTKSQVLILGFGCGSVALIASYSSSSFSRDDVYGLISQPDDSSSSSTILNHSSKLNGFLQRIKTCNRGFEMKSEFLPFIIEEKIAGYVHNQFASHLRKFQDVFAFLEDNLFGNGGDGGGGGGYNMLNPSLKSPEDSSNRGLEALPMDVMLVVECVGGIAWRSRLCKTHQTWRGDQCSG